MEQEIKRILWIDDDIEGYPLIPYIDEFKVNGFTIVKAKNPDESEKILSKEHDFQCIIVDISMPCGNRIPMKAVKGGMLTGLVVLKELVDNPDLKNVKKVVFCAVVDKEVQDFCEKQTPQIPCLKIIENAPHELVEKIEMIISQPQK